MCYCLWLFSFGCISREYLRSYQNGHCSWQFAHAATLQCCQTKETWWLVQRSDIILTLKKLIFLLPNNAEWYTYTFCMLFCLDLFEVRINDIPRGKTVGALTDLTILFGLLYSNCMPISIIYGLNAHLSQLLEAKPKQLYRFDSTYQT